MPYDNDDDDDEEDGQLIDNDSDDEAPVTVKKRKKQTSKSKAIPSMIDDAAELSGEEGGSDEEDEDDENENNDYVRDGFVVDEIDEINKDDLEDSDDDDDNDDDEEEAPRKKSRISKVRHVQQLDDDDFDLINEARGGGAGGGKDGGRTAREEVAAIKIKEEARAVKAKDEHDLQKGLFYDSEDDAPATVKKNARPKVKAKVEMYDEDGMDDFIDDDIGDQDDIMGGSKYETAGGVSEAQMQEASDIFGTDYLEFMQGGEDDDEFIETNNKYKEQGVGVDYGVEDSDEDFDDDDDLFGDDEDDQQKKEALKLKREKREMTKVDRRRQAKFKKTQQAKAELRKNFEPVQLIENFCTERDDEIRIRDAPERFFDWKTPFHGPAEDKEISPDEEEEAMWIVNKIPAVAAHFYSVPITKSGKSPVEMMEQHQRDILESIIYALRYMHREKLEPAFIKRYRQDYVTSNVVQENLYAIMDEDGEWEVLTSKREAVDDLLTNLVVSSEHDETKGAEEYDVLSLKNDLDKAQEKLDDVVKQEMLLKDQVNDTNKDDDDDDDDLFENDDDDEKKEIKQQQKATIESHLKTVQEMLLDRAQRVADLAQALKTAQIRNTVSNTGPSLNVTKKLCRVQLWNASDYKQYLMGLTDEHLIDDMKRYLVLLKEGNDAIRKKEGGEVLVDDKKRSRSMNNDLYRSRVSEGMRPIVYEFMLSPFRAGIKLEEMMTKGQFSYDRPLPGEEGSRDPLKWVAPVIIESPIKFASDKIGSGELVQIAAGDLEYNVAEDPLSGCRFVAAIELAYEPRLRRHLRAIFREKAFLTTRPTKKGLDNIDAFHDYYGLHLIKNKPIKEHFPMDEKESENRKSNLGPEERMELDLEMKKREHESCLQYLRIVEAEHFGQVNVHVHMPYRTTNDESWFKEAKKDYLNKDNQDLTPFMTELEKVFLPLDGDTDEWNDERRKILRFALTKVLLPDFERETRRDLRDAAARVGVTEAAENLKGMAMEGPYRPTSLNQDNRFLVPTGDLPLVGVCTSADGKDATYLASVTDGGASSDHLAIPSGTRIDNDLMREKVVNFLMTARPSAVVVGTSGGFASRMLTRKLGELVAHAVERWNNRFIQSQDEDDEEFEIRTSQFRRMHPNYDLDDDEPWKCNVDLVDDSVSQLFSRSVRGKKEFPEMELNLKCAIAIARHAKDPLSELTYAWNVASDSGLFGTEMFYLNVHPMQRLLPRTRLLREYERVICEAVAEVGVDINAACSHDHLLGLLSFVPGLGPRKAANLKQSISRIGGLVGSRRDLLAKRLMGPTVYNNAVAFLRIRDVEKLASQFIHPLDDTRLHPDVYHRNNWAVKIAIDALERLEDDGGKGADKDSFGIKCLKDVISNSGEEVRRLFNATKCEWEAHYGPTFNIAAWDPIVNVPGGHWRDKVEDLDLEAFADINEQNGMGRWNSHLQMIKWEFRLPFEDPRKPMEPITGEKLFRLVTGETDQSLRAGKEVTGKVVKNGDFGSRVKLEGDIPAFIPLRNLADEHVESAEDIVTVGSVVTAIVIEVKKDHMCVDMSLRMEDFRKPHTSWDRPATLPPLDNCFDMKTASRIEDEKIKEREARLSALQLSLGSIKMDDDDSRRRSGRVTRRACAHPAFRNAKNDEVDRELRDAGDLLVGEALIRPSSKSSDSLAIHWVVRPGCIKVIEVIEEDKDNDASIGNYLKIKNERYGSIDEMLGRYIAPMNDNVEALTSHRKFIDLLEDELDERLKEEKRKSPAGIYYNICWMEMHPGYASLRFILSSSPRNHPIGIAPEGFTWGSKIFSSLDKLLNEFKKNPRGLSSSSNRSSQGSVSSRGAVQSNMSASIDTNSQSSNQANKAGEDSSARPSRWGARPPPPSGAPPVAPIGWGQMPSVQVATYGVTANGRFAPPPPDHRPPPPMLPPPGLLLGLPPPPMGLPRKFLQLFLFVLWFSISFTLYFQLLVHHLVGHRLVCLPIIYHPLQGPTLECLLQVHLLLTDPEVRGIKIIQSGIHLPKHRIDPPWNLGPSCCTK